MKPEQDWYRRLALVRAGPRIRAAQPAVDRVVAALLAERYPHAREHLLALGYPVTVDGISAAMVAIDRGLDPAAAAGGDLADLWAALDQAVAQTTGSGLTARGS
jgi:hypothetical protein